jgi:hypothetical protein
MKKIIYSLLTLILLLSFFPVQSSAAIKDKIPSEAPRPVEPIKTTELKVVVRTEKTVDLTSLSPEKKSNQVEVRTEGRRHNRGGVLYVSGGAILVVILILILL